MRFRMSHEQCGYPVVYTSAREQRGIDALLERAGRKGDIGGRTIGCGQVIDSSTVCSRSASMETGAISRKIERGRHTTRHSEIIPIKEQTYIMDTPGFSSTLDLPGLEKEDLWMVLSGV